MDDLPPPPAYVEAVEGEPIEVMPESTALFFAQRHVYADKVFDALTDLEGRHAVVLADREGLQLDNAGLVEANASMQERLSVAEGGPSWNTVAAVGGGGVAAGVVLTVAAIVIAR